MKIEGTHQIHAAATRVYQLLIDPDVLQRCIPGCERLERSEDNTFAATIRAGVGSIKGLFTGKVRLEDLKPPEHFRIIVDGKGTPGFLKGTGDFTIKEEASVTTVSYVGNVQVGGTIAGVGQRLILASAKMMASQFFTALTAEAETAVGEPPPTHGFFRTALRWLSGRLRKLVHKT